MTNFKPQTIENVRKNSEWAADQIEENYNVEKLTPKDIRVLEYYYIGLITLEEMETELSK